MKKQLFILALLVSAGGYAASAQTSTTTTKETTITPAAPAYPAAPAPISVPTQTTTESTTTTVEPGSVPIVQPAAVQVIPEDTKVKEKRNKSKVKPRN